MAPKIGILDLSLGNWHAVDRIINVIGVETKAVKSSAGLSDISGLIIPGVGNFQEVMRRIDKRSMRAGLIDFISSNRPFLGICSGYQILFKQSAESTFPGLGIINSRVEYLTTERSGIYKIPNIGWHRLEGISSRSGGEKGRYYFAHSYAVTTVAKKFNPKYCVLGETRFVAKIQRANMTGVQFHPEKSYDDGVAIFKDFVEKVRRRND